MTESMREYKIFEVLDGTKEDYLTLVHDPSIKVIYIYVLLWRVPEFRRFKMKLLILPYYLSLGDNIMALLNVVDKNMAEFLQHYY